MRRLEKRDLAKYPFLKGAKAYVQGSGISIDSLIRAQSGKGEDLMKLAAARVKAALRPPSFDETNTDIKNADDEIYAYAIARLLASCMDDPSVLDKLARYEAERSAYYLKGEGPELTAYIARSVGIDMTTPDMGVKQYVELASRMRDPRWRLVNRDVIHGRVLCTPDDYTVILRERIRQVIRSQLPLTVPGPVAVRLRTHADDVSHAYQEQILEQYGEVDEGCFPPCIRAIIAAVTDGTNIPHTARFALVAFLHTIGLDETAIVEVFARAPDFDISRTMYQVEHISGSGGTEYTPPGCATMKTYGLCVNKDKFCEKTVHPLSYYKYRKKISGKKP
ncbi:DNA primase large subunit PriL [Methanogenium organophilum]|uniref:DNA primase large subunit PriL n=1 Tax=Methanogenium organophilum TaxID=2199 RepID=A0A9X9S3L0_METOG|nr:DNA primase large subunit PriL [Methanogenium organophilum]WAI00870.1 DNA primase large subunit PriL [Methanogenium organophilum]